MATCSQHYLDLVRTASGLTLAAPWRGLSFFGETKSKTPTPFEYDEWRDLSRKLAREAFTHLEALGTLGMLATAKWNELRPRVMELWQEASELPEAFAIAQDATAPEGVVENYRVLADTAKTVAQDSACAMETIDNAILALGHQPPSISTRPRQGGDTILGTALTLLLVGGAVGGALYAINRSRTSGGATTPAEAA